MEVTLEQMLAAREERAYRQYSLNRQWGRPIVSFSMNIPGPVKDTPLIRRGFRAGCALLDHRIPRDRIRYRNIHYTDTGCEAVYVVDMDPVAIKKITTAIEDGDALGRLFDMDVLDVALNKLDRERVGGKDRGCIVCGTPGRGCASRRAHSVPELQKAVRDILAAHFRAADARKVAAWAVRSLLDEVCATPKPGLVDRRNNGAHKDMDIFTFMASASALPPYFLACVEAGQDTADLPPEETFARLRPLGLRAETEMLAATRGVNTHKGAIFTLGVLCGAAGRLWKSEGTWDADAVLREVSDMTADAMEADFLLGGSGTAGRRLFLDRGVRGIRGEAASGLPSVAKVGLPVYRRALADGLDKNDAGILALLHLVGKVEDTNLLARGGPEGAAEAAAKVRDLLKREPHPSREALEALDDWFISRNLSPGGCADLLAATYLVYALSTSIENEEKDLWNE